MYDGIPYVQRKHGIGSFLVGLFRAVKHLTIRGVRALGQEGLNTGAQISVVIGTKHPERKIKYRDQPSV